MITFRHVSDSLGESLHFQVEGREVGYIAQSLNGSFVVFFADMADAPQGVTLERSTAPGSQGIYAVGLASLDAALALVRTTYSVVASTTDAPISRTAAPRVPCASAPGVIHTCPVSPSPQRAAFYSQAFVHPRPDAPRFSATLTTRNT